MRSSGIIVSDKSLSPVIMTSPVKRPMEDKTVVVPALEKALDILEFIALRGTGASVKTLASELSIPIASAYRTVRYLCLRRYLAEEAGTEGSYILGSQFLYLADLTTRQSSLISEAVPYMRKLAAATGQTCQLAVLQDNGVTYIEQTLPTKPVTIIAALRTIVPINVSACGKVLVAALPEHQQQHFLQQANLLRQTPNTIVDPILLQRELNQVRRDGYALDHEEYARGIGCCAAPIIDHRQHTIAAIGITGHISDYSQAEALQQLIDHVRQAAAHISHVLGGEPNGERLRGNSWG
jgi:DNA-binding IclR family transcriptional regulator